VFDATSKPESPSSLIPIQLHVLACFVMARRGFTRTFTDDEFRDITRSHISAMFMGWMNP
jgi:hypothetical protein